MDIIIDHALKPWLVEVNHLPSFATDSPLDQNIKSRVIEQTISIVKAKPHDRFIYEQAQRCKAEERLYNSQSWGIVRSLSESLLCDCLRVCSLSMSVLQIRLLSKQ